MNFVALQSLREEGRTADGASGPVIFSAVRLKECQRQSSEALPLTWLKLNRIDCDWLAALVQQSKNLRQRSHVLRAVFLNCIQGL